MSPKSESENFLKIIKMEKKTQIGIIVDKSKATKSLSNEVLAPSSYYKIYDKSNSKGTSFKGIQKLIKKVEKWIEISKKSNIIFK